MLKPYQATMLMIKYSIYGPQQSGARTPVPTTSPWQACHWPLQSLWKVPGSGTIWIKSAPWSVCLPCAKSKLITQQTTMEEKNDQPQQNSSFPRRTHTLSWAQATVWQNFRTISKIKHFSQLLPPNQTVQVWPACPFLSPNVSSLGTALLRNRLQTLLQCVTYKWRDIL